MTSEAAATAARAPGRRGSSPAGRGSSPAGWLRHPFDVLLATVLAGLTFAVHDVGYLLRLPFWTDEAWVAISTRLPVTTLLHVTGSTPVGWSLLLRLVPSGGDQRLRLVPLVFAALTVAAAYVYARILPWRSVPIARVAAVLAGCAALLLPSALARDDLKQYTADAFVALLLLSMSAHLQNGWSRRRLCWLGAAVVGAFLFSAVAAFVGAAVFGSLLLVEAGARRWSAAREVAGVGLVAGALLGTLYLLLYRPGTPPGLHAYWAAYYLPVAAGPGPSWRFLVDGAHSTASYLGMGPVWLAGALLVAGVLTLLRLGRGGSALVVPLLVLEMIVLSGLRQYPLFDLRTSHFLTTALAVTAAVGLAGLTAELVRAHLALTVAVALAGVALFGYGVRHDLRAEVINKPSDTVEDLRTPTAYLAAHLRADDVVVVNMHSNWGFAYYWPFGSPAVQPVTTNLQQFVTVFPGQPRILVATDRTRAAVQEVMARAATLAAAPDARVWFVHQHTIPSELQDYAAAAAAHGWRATTQTPGLDLLLPSR